jgi:hypothetical protein
MLLRKLRGEVRENVEQVERAHGENRCFQPCPLYQIPKLVNYFDVNYPVAPDRLEMLQRGVAGFYAGLLAIMAEPDEVLRSGLPIWKAAA